MDTRLIRAILLVAPLAGAKVPDLFVARGAGGGGALFAPSFSDDGQELTIACDMSELFRSTNRGLSWELVPFRQFQGNRSSKVFHSGGVRYAINHADPTGAERRTISKSTDGTSWSPLPSDPADGEVFDLQADPSSPRRLLATSWAELFSSRDGGASWKSAYAGLDGDAGLRMAGAFWDGADVYVGTSDGLLVSHDSGATFARQTLGGIPATQAIASLSGGKAGGVVKLLAATTGKGDLYNGMNIEELNGSQEGGLWTWSPGAASWTSASTGIAATDRLYLVSQARSTVDTLYAAGGEEGSDWPTLYRSLDGGKSWKPILGATGNTNVATGWAGSGGDRDWSYGGMACGLAVAGNNGRVLAYTDLGFLHVSEDAGTTWRQGYVDPRDQNAAGKATPKGRSYRSAGLENTTAWQVFWADSARVFGAFSDIRGVRSTDGGTSWGFAYAGHSDNTMYRIARGGDGKIHAATATVHDLYQSTRLADGILDAGRGQILSSSNGGATWTQTWNPGRIVAWVESDPSDPKTLYASVVHSSTGGVYVTRDLDKGAAATWTRLPAPPRTQGHPYNLVVLPDGSLLSSWSGRRDAQGAFTASSGIFRMPKGGTAWEDLSDPGMRYWTKDVVVDPSDATARTWWAAVFSGWGGAPNGLGGLYRTTDAGAHWTRVWDADRVESIAFPPGAGTEAYATTEVDGLWHTDVRAAGSPVFQRVDSYPFRQPVRVFFNPYDTAEMWVASFGNSLRMGRRDGRSIGVSKDLPAYRSGPFVRVRAGALVVEGLFPGASYAMTVSRLDGRTVMRRSARSDAQGSVAVADIPRGASMLRVDGERPILLVVP
jgi:hypothetical protein